MRISRLSIILILIAILSWTGYSLIRQKWAMESEIANLSDTTKKLSTENQSIQNGISYYEHPENILKEARKQFPYKTPGERVLIVVPSTTSTTATSTKK